MTECVGRREHGEEESVDKRRGWDHCMAEFVRRPPH